MNESVTEPSTRPYLIETVDDAAIVQLYADGFAQLSREERVLIWHLSEAALWGRDIYYDQRYRLALVMRETLEQILDHSAGVPESVLVELTRYTKLFWLNTGPYNGLTAQKFVLRLTRAELEATARQAVGNGARLPCQLSEELIAAFIDATFEPAVTDKNPDGGADILTASANNLYVGVTTADLEGFNERYPLNSRLVREAGTLVEEVYCLTGRYGEYIARIIEHLDAARAFATPAMRRALDALIAWYRTGEDGARREYDRAWVADQDSPVDTINGFIEVYMDPRGHKGAWEGIVFYVNAAKTRDAQRIASHAQWFEDRMPWDPVYRRREVQGVTARAIDVVVETGDAGPMTPIGINLPNDQAIRETHGSKSVSLSNVLEAYDRSLPAAYHREFCWSEEEAERASRWSSFAGELSTNLHEIIGHGSGLVEARLEGSPQTFLREYYSALEETRADLVALYFIADREMMALGLIPSEAFATVVLAEYEAYVRNVLVQLRRVRQGTRLEEDHMRNRQTIVRWLMAHTRAVEERRRDGKTFFVVRDVDEFRAGTARLLADVQRIKAQGDYDAARALFDAFGISFPGELRDEVVRRVDSLGLPSYTGFIMPTLTPVEDADGRVVDAAISYPCNFAGQMLQYSARYCLRPVPFVGPSVPRS
ncbi:MAG: peptidase M49 [Vicinamibacterales bacterium]